MTSIGADSDEPVAPLAASAKTNLAKWLATVAKSDLRELPSIIAHEAVYHLPVEWHPYPGRKLVVHILRFSDAGEIRIRKQEDPVVKKVAVDGKPD